MPVRLKLLKQIANEMLERTYVASISPRRNRASLLTHRENSE